MLRMQRTIFLVVISFSIWAMSVLFAQEESPEAVSEVSAEEAIAIVTREKESAIKAGDQRKADAIDAMIKDFEAGKITQAEFMQPGGKQKQQRDSSQKMPYGGSKPPEKKPTDSYSQSSSQDNYSKEGAKPVGTPYGDSKKGSFQGVDSQYQEKGPPGNYTQDSYQRRGDYSQKEGSSTGSMTQGKESQYGYTQGTYQGSESKYQGDSSQGKYTQGSYYQDEGSKYSGKQGYQGSGMQGSFQGMGGYSQQGSTQQGMFYGDMPKDKDSYKQTTGPSADYEKEGVPTQEKVLKELQKLKEKAINSGDMDEAKRLHSEIENVRKGKSEAAGSYGEYGGYSEEDKESLKLQEKSKYLKELSQGGGRVTEEKAVELMERLKEEAVKSGNKEKAKEIESEMEGIKNTKEIVKEQEKSKFLQQISQEEGGLTKEKALKKMQKMKEEAIKAGDMEKAKEIHAELQNIGKMDASSFGGKEAQLMDTAVMKEQAIKELQGMKE